MKEAAIVALFIQMLRAGIIDEDTLHDAADECEAKGQDMAAHQLRCLLVEASATPATDLRAAEKRPGLRAIDGGNAS